MLRFPCWFAIHKKRPPFGEACKAELNGALSTCSSVKLCAPAPSEKRPTHTATPMRRIIHRPRKKRLAHYPDEALRIQIRPMNPQHYTQQL
jgi:hypothetical protein